MKHQWERITLICRATVQDDERIPLKAKIGAFALVLAICATYQIALVIGSTH